MARKVNFTNYSSKTHIKFKLCSSKFHTQLFIYLLIYHVLGQFEFVVDGQRVKVKGESTEDQLFEKIAGRFTSNFIKNFHATEK